MNPGADSHCLYSGSQGYKTIRLPFSPKRIFGMMVSNLRVFNVPNAAAVESNFDNSSKFLTVGAIRWISPIFSFSNASRGLSHKCPLISRLSGITRRFWVASTRKKWVENQWGLASGVIQCAKYIRFSVKGRRLADSSHVKKSPPPLANPSLAQIRSSLDKSCDSVSVASFGPAKRTRVSSNVSRIAARYSPWA